MSVFNTERLAQILLAPVISEKSTFVGEKHNQVVFRVARDATKPEIKAAVETMLSKKDEKLEVQNVRIVNVRGKGKAFRQVYRPSQFMEKGLCLPQGGPGNHLC
jgi:large subunit ribosomal protein L23